MILSHIPLEFMVLQAESCTKLSMLGIRRHSSEEDAMFVHDQTKLVKVSASTSVIELLALTVLARFWVAALGIFFVTVSIPSELNY